MSADQGRAEEDPNRLRRWDAQVTFVVWEETAEAAEEFVRNSLDGCRTPSAHYFGPVITEGEQ